MNNNSRVRTLTSTIPTERDLASPNTRPQGGPVIGNVNQAFEPASQGDMKYIDPPSYEEAIKAMIGNYNPTQANEVPPYLQYNHESNQNIRPQVYPCAHQNSVNVPDQQSYNPSPYWMNNDILEYKTFWAKVLVWVLLICIVLFMIRLSGVWE